MGELIAAWIVNNNSPLPHQATPYSLESPSKWLLGPNLSPDYASQPSVFGLVEYPNNRA